MTHTLHRRGDIESLNEDYIMLIIPSRQVEQGDVPQKIGRVWDVLARYSTKLVNFGNVTTGNSHKTDIETLKKDKGWLSHAVFRDRETLKACLADIKESNIGLSVVISGICSEVEAVCSEIGLTPHTIEYSLGVHGNTEQLPEADILDITTMCGHAMVSPHLVDHLIAEIKKGLPFTKAAIELSKGCICGIFNPHRAEKLLRKIV